MRSFWRQVNGSELSQGDLLPQCLIPIFGAAFGAEDLQEVGLAPVDLVIITQTCDLIQGKAELVASCPIYPLDVFEELNPAFRQKGRWEEVRKGRHEGLHLLASPVAPTENRAALVTDFRQIFSLPLAYLAERATELGDRWRLDSPFLEHFSQAFARFFMRVGLPSSIPPFR